MTTFPLPESAIADLVFTTKCTREFAIRTLTERSNASAAKFSAAAPEPWANATAAQLRSEEAAREAQDAVAHVERLIKGLESELLQLGKYRLKLESVRSLKESADNLPALAFDLVDRMLTAIENPCPNTESNYAVTLSELQRLTVLKPHLPKVVAGMEAKEASLVRRIADAAKESQIDLGKLLVTMRADAGLSKDGREIRNIELHRLFSGGYLDNIE